MKRNEKMMRDQYISRPSGRVRDVMIALVITVASILGFTMPSGVSAQAAEGKIDSNVLSVTQSNATIVGNVAGKESDVFFLNYNAAVGDVITITVPRELTVTQYDTNFNGAIPVFDKSTNTLTITTTTAGRVEKYQLSVKAETSPYQMGKVPVLTNEMTPRSKSGNANFIQPGSYSLSITAKKAGIAYTVAPEDATVTVSNGTYVVGTWNQVAFNRQTYVKGAEYSFGDNNFLGLGASMSTPSDGIHLNIPMSQKTVSQVPGGFLLNMTKSTAGWTQPGGAGTALIWEYPYGNDMTHYNAVTSIVGTFTSAAGTYTAAAGSYTEGYFGYDSTLTRIPLATPWTVTLVTSIPKPRYSVDPMVDVLIGSAANREKHPTDIRFEQRAWFQPVDVTFEDMKNLVVKLPSIDGSKLVGSRWTINSYLGEKTTFTYTKQSGETGTVPVTLSETQLLNKSASIADAAKAGESALFTVTLPDSVDDPYISVTATATRLAHLVSDGSVGTFGNMWTKYDAAGTYSDGTPIKNGDKKDSVGGKYTATSESGLTWSQAYTFHVTYYDLMRYTGEVSCGKVGTTSSPVSADNVAVASTLHSTAADTCTARFDEQWAVSPYEIAWSNSNDDSYQYGTLNEPILCLLLPRSAVYKDYSYRNAKSSNVDASFQQSIDYQQPKVTTYVSEWKGQTVVKLDWTGRGAVNKYALNNLVVTYTFPKNGVNSTSTVASYINLANDPQTAMAPATGAIKDTDAATYKDQIIDKDAGNTVLLGSMYAKISGPEVLSGSFFITNNAGVRSMAAQNNLSKGTKHSLQMEIFSNLVGATSNVAGLINLPTDSSGLGLQMAQAGTVKTATGTSIADTGGAGDAAYLLYSTSTQPTGGAINTAGYMRAAAVGEAWDTIRSVILYVPNLTAQSDYIANLPIDAPKASEQLARRVSIPMSVAANATSTAGTTSTNPEVFNVGSVTDLFYSFAGSVTWIDGDDADALRPDFVTVRLNNVNGGKLGEVKVNANSARPDDPNVWDFDFDIPVNSTTIVDIMGMPQKFSVQQVETPSGYTVSVNGFAITDTHSLGPCYFGTSVPDANSCPAIQPGTMLKRSTVAYEYAIIGGGTEGTGTDGYAGVLNSTSFNELISNNVRTGLTWEFTEDATDAPIGSFVIPAGAASFSEGAWAWSPDAQRYFEGAGRHYYTVTLHPTGDAANEVSYRAAVTVLVPQAQVSDSVVELGSDNAMSGNLTGDSSEGALGNATKSIIWTDGRGVTDTTNLPFLTAKPDATLQATFMEGTNPNAVMEAEDSFTPYTSTTFQAQVALSGAMLDAAAPAVLGPSGPTAYTGTAENEYLAGATMLVRTMRVLADPYNTNGEAIGTPLESVADSESTSTSADSSKAAFTVYVLGESVSSLPLTGGSATGRDTFALAAAFGAVSLVALAGVFVSQRQRRR